MKKTIRVGNRDYLLVRCLSCKKPRYRRKFYALKYKAHFCSRRCLSEARSKGAYGAPLTSIKSRCSSCGSELKRKKSEASKSGKYFCSKKCLSVGISKRLVGVNPIRSFTPKAGRQRARYIFPESKPCEVCGKPNSQRHHKDGNPCNNRPSNIQRLCPKHHIHADRMDHMRRIQPVGSRISVAGCVRDKTGKFSKR